MIMNNNYFKVKSDNDLFRVILLVYFNYLNKELREIIIIYNL